MKVNKTVCNLVRGSMNNIIRVNQETIEDVLVAIRDVKRSVLLRSDIRIYGRACSLCEDMIGSNEEIKGQDLIRRLEEQVAILKIMSKNALSIVSSLTTEGFSDVTFDLPLLILTSCGKDLGYSYLMASGIKTNASKKTGKEELSDDLERKLLEYEKKMVSYIKDDLTIDLESIEEFINYYKEYLYLSYENMSFSSQFRFEPSMDINLMAMGLYIVYGNPQYEVKRDDFVQMLLEYDRLVESGVPVSKVVKDLCIKSFKESDKKKSTPRVVVSKESTRREIHNISKEDSLLAGFVKNGLVVKPCDIEEFERLLDESQVTSSKKEDLIDQMLDLLATEETQKFEEALATIRGSILTEDEMDLYTRARNKKNASYILEDIDLTIALIYEATSQEDKSQLRQELSSMFDILRNILGVDYSSKRPTKPHHL